MIMFDVQLTAWSRVLLEELTGSQVVKFPALYGTLKFITTLTRTTSWRCILILSSLFEVVPFPQASLPKPCILLLLSTWMEFWLVKVVPNIWTVPPFQRNYYLPLYCDFVIYSVHKTDHILVFRHLLLDQWSVCVFLCSMYASFQYINVISIKLKLMCTISFQAFLVYLNPSNDIL